MFRLRVLFLVAVSFLFSCKKETQPDISTGLTVHLPLDGIAQDMVSGATGINYRATPVPDRKNSSNMALQFASNDSAFLDFGDLEGASFPENIFTIACWVRVSDTLSAGAVLSKRTDTGPFEYSLDNHFNQSVFNLDNWVASGSETVYGVDPLSASAPITPGMWQHLAFVSDGEFLKTYSNGILQSGTDERHSSAAFSNTSAPLQIGKGGAFGVNYFFNGGIDDVRLYNRALDETAIRKLSEL